MTERSRDNVEILMKRGVRILKPETVYIGEDVDPERISKERVTIYPGCRIFGNDTLIMAGATLGFEAPATVVNCQIGPDVELRGGFFKKTVFLERARMGSEAQIREGCILEEESGGAHCVGLKQTILFPFVTLGSLINFCDCLMAGGTSRNNHSEVGSSYIHFNFTHNQDKATPSLIGDVPRGVMLNQEPIFLGGQGGLVGPARIEFGTVAAAGTILRRDCLKGGKILLGTRTNRRELDLYPGLYPEIKPRVLNNLNYIASLIALRRWYSHVRSLFLSGDGMREELLRSAVEILDRAVEERVRQLIAFADKLPRSVEIYRKRRKTGRDSFVLSRKREFFQCRHRIGDFLLGNRENDPGSKKRDYFLSAIDRARKESGDGYTDVIRRLPEKTATAGTSWLQGIVDGITAEALRIIPSFNYTD